MDLPVLTEWTSLSFLWTFSKSHGGEMGTRRCALPVLGITPYRWSTFGGQAQVIAQVVTSQDVWRYGVGTIGAASGNAVVSRLWQGGDTVSQPKHDKLPDLSPLVSSCQRRTGQVSLIIALQSVVLNLNNFSQSQQS